MNIKKKRVASHAPQKYHHNQYDATKKHRAACTVIRPGFVYCSGTIFWNCGVTDPQIHFWPIREPVTPEFEDTFDRTVASNSVVRRLMGYLSFESFQNLACEQHGFRICTDSAQGTLLRIIVEPNFKNFDFY